MNNNFANNDKKIAEYQEEIKRLASKVEPNEQRLFFEDNGYKFLESDRVEHAALDRLINLLKISKNEKDLVTIDGVAISKGQKENYEDALIVLNTFKSGARNPSYDFTNNDKKLKEYEEDIRTIISRAKKSTNREVLEDCYGYTIREKDRDEFCHLLDLYDILSCSPYLSSGSNLIENNGIVILAELEEQYTDILNSLQEIRQAKAATFNQGGSQPNDKPQEGINRNGLVIEKYVKAMEEILNTKSENWPKEIDTNKVSVKDDRKTRCYNGLITILEEANNCKLEDLKNIDGALVKAQDVDSYKELLAELEYLEQVSFDKPKTEEPTFEKKKKKKKQKVSRIRKLSSKAQELMNKRKKKVKGKGIKKALDKIKHAFDYGRGKATNRYNKAEIKKCEQEIEALVNKAKKSDGLNKTEIVEKDENGEDLNSYLVLNEDKAELHILLDIKDVLEKSTNSKEKTVKVGSIRVLESDLKDYQAALNALKQERAKKNNNQTMSEEDRINLLEHEIEELQTSLDMATTEEDKAVLQDELEAKRAELDALNAKKR